MKVAYQTISYCIVLFLLILISCSKPGSKQEEGAPLISEVYPLQAKAGDTIVARGKNLPVEFSSLQITLNDQQARIITVTPDSLRAILPATFGSGKLILKVGGLIYEGPEFNTEYEAVVTTIAGNGSVGDMDGVGEWSSFNCPWGIAPDKDDNLFIADCYNRLIRRISANTHEVTTFRIPVYVEGKNFYSPYNIAVDQVNRDVFVTDFNEHVMRMDSTGAMRVIFEGEAPMAGIAVSPDRNSLFISKTNHGQLIRMNRDGSNAQLYSTVLTTPRNIFFDREGKMFVTAYPGPVYEISNNGFASHATPPVEFQGWEAVKDTLGNFYLSDHVENRVRMIDREGNVITLAGNGVSADVDGIGLNASFNGPQGLAIDSKGNLYTTTYNYDTHGGNRVRKIEIRVKVSFND